MISNAVRLFHIGELVCLSNCISTACGYFERDEVGTRSYLGMNYNSAEALRAAISAELRGRPEYLDDAEPWMGSPSAADMSLDVISQLTTIELRCFANCIKKTLECYEEWEFHTHVGVTRKFAEVFITALEMELAKRSDRPVS